MDATNFEHVAAAGASGAHHADSGEASFTTLPRLARIALAANGGDVEAAKDALLADLLEDADTLRLVVHRAIEDAIEYRVEHAMRGRREVILRNTTGDRGAVIALAGGLSMALLDMPLANGVRLRDASREQVVEQANRYGSLANDMAHKSRWLALIAKATPASRKVGDAMTDEKAAALWRKAKQEV